MAYDCTWLFDFNSSWFSIIHHASSEIIPSLFSALKYLQTCLPFCQLIAKSTTEMRYAPPQKPSALLSFHIANDEEIVAERWAAPGRFVSQKYADENQGCFCTYFKRDTVNTVYLASASRF